MVNVKVQTLQGSCSQKHREIYDLLHLDSGVFGGNRAGVDLDAEDALICGIQGVTRLSSQAPLDNHAKLLPLCLVHGDLHEAGGQGVVLDSQFDDLAGLEKAHHGLLMTHIPDVGGVNSQDSVSHPEFIRSCS